MPFTIEVDKPKRLTRIVGSGKLTRHEIAESIRSYYKNPTPYVIWDLSEATLKSVSSDQVKDLADLLNDHRKHAISGRSAIVSPEDLTYGIARMFETIVNLAGKHPLRETLSFRSGDEALAWIKAGEKKTDPEKK
jgi:hypothetical protein